MLASCFLGAMYLQLITGQSDVLDSAIRSRPSTLTSLSYICQGFPRNVLDTRFRYERAESRAFEAYLAKVLDGSGHTDPRLMEAAFFLSTRVYRDNNGNDFLLLSRYDSGHYLAMLDELDVKKLGSNDVILRATLRACFGLTSKDVSNMKSEWSRSVGRKGAFMSDNVMRVLGTFSVSDSLGREWEFPFPGR